MTSDRAVEVLTLGPGSAITGRRTLEVGLGAGASITSVAVDPRSEGWVAVATVQDGPDPGHHPDGRSIVTADQGEPTDGANPHGGLTIIDADTLVPTTLTLDDPTHEPEYLAVDERGVWVTAQEASRLLRYDFEDGQTHARRASRARPGR